MTYSEDLKLEIGRELYEGELSIAEAVAKYNICRKTAFNYKKNYRDKKELPVKNVTKISKVRMTSNKKPQTLEDLNSMTKEELIKELVKARVSEARLKKGYEVKGDGSVVLYSNKNIK